MSWFHAARARARLAFQGDDAEARMNEEIALHVDMETERLQREEGLDAGEARRRAVLAFGATEAHKEELRGGRGLAWLGGLKLDLKLGARMLVKYPGLTVVGGLAMAFAIWAGAVSFVMVGQVVDPKLPLPEGERIVRIVNWDEATYQQEPRSLSDFLLWRDALRSVTDLGAYTDVTHNLIVEGDAQPVSVASISASAFDVAPVVPLHGRALEPGDERADAAPVVVLSHDVWRDRFASDPGVVGRLVQLDDTHATVVGVMPEGFGFPIAHEAWTPLRLDATAARPRAGIPIEVFGRLAPGATLESAEAELAQLGARVAAEQPATHEHLEPHVVAYTAPYPESVPGAWILTMVRVFAILLLGLICSNVALLMFARAAARENELVVRSSLGASRSRILVQLFAEALVLGTAAAIVGLVGAQIALRVWGVEFLERNYAPLPFWFDISLSPGSIVYAIVLTLIGAAIAGMLPARKITRGLGASLRSGSAGGGGVRFGGVWTAIIVTQVAATVAFPAIVYALLGEARRIQSYDMGFAAEQYLGVTLDMDVDADSSGSFTRFASSLEALRTRLEAEPGVGGVTFVSALPRDYHRSDDIELEASVPAPDDPEVAVAYIEPAYFQVLGSPILEGRAFTPADGSDDARAVIVDEEFVARMLKGQNAVGRRIRFAPDEATAAADTAPWLEIVGVVERLGMEFAADRDRAAGVYVPIALQRHADVELIVHAPEDPLALATPVRQLAIGVDPMLRVVKAQRLDRVADELLWMVRLWLSVAYALTGVALLLSLAGIYAVMSFTVVRRTREIGVRVALGGTPRRILASIFRRPFTQVATGIAIGFVLVAAAAYSIAGRRPDGQPRVVEEMLTLGDIGLIAVYAAIMLAVCLLACVVPTMRVLRVQPTEALRAE